MRTLAVMYPQQLFWLLLSSQCHLSVAWRNGSSSGSRTRSLLFQCDYRQPGDIYGNAVASATAVYSVRASLS